MTEIPVLGAESRKSMGVTRIGKGFQGRGSHARHRWAVTYADPEDGQVFNCWIDQHDTGHLAGAVPILVMDVFEHAFMIDYGLKRADYIAAFFKAVDWKVVSQRYNAAIRKGEKS